MLTLFLLAAAQLVPTLSPPDSAIREIRQGPMPAENHPLPPRHWKGHDPSLPDVAVKDLRIDGDTLYVLVANSGGSSIRGPIRVMALAQADGVRSEAAPATIGKLVAGEARWVPLKQFSVKVASTKFSGPLFLLDKADAVLAEVVLPSPAPSALDRSGQGCDRCQDFNDANNVLRERGSNIARGRPD
jgi:hypothetical protein